MGLFKKSEDQLQEERQLSHCKPKKRDRPFDLASRRLRSSSGTRQEEMKTYHLMLVSYFAGLCIGAWLW